MDYYVRMSDRTDYFDDVDTAKQAFLDAGNEAAIGIKAVYENNGFLDVFYFKNGKIVYSDTVDQYDIWDYDELGSEGLKLIGQLRITMQDVLGSDS